MAEQERNLLDELEGEQEQGQEQQNQVTGQMEVLRPVIEKMEAYAEQVRARGKEVLFSERQNVEWNQDEVIKHGFGFMVVEKKHGEDSDYEVKEKLEKIFRAELNRLADENVYVHVRSKMEVYHPEITNLIVLSVTPHGSFLYYTRNYSAEVTYGPLNLLSKPNTVSIENGRRKLIPEGFTNEDVESCFKFLLGKSGSVWLSKEAAEKSGICFIATAVYGSETAPEVVVLRDFRDNILLSSKVGQTIVDLYYILSPPVARLLDNNRQLRNMIRKVVVQPIVNRVRSK